MLGAIEFYENFAKKEVTEKQIVKMKKMLNYLKQIVKTQ